MFLIILLLSVFALCKKDDTKLYLGIIIDGLAQKDLMKYSGNLEYGIKEIFEDGTVYTNAKVDPYVTQTATSHPMIYTGAPPSVNRIAAQEWFNRITGDKEYAFYDPDPTILSTAGQATPVGVANGPGKMIGTTFADEFLRVYQESKALSISGKDRGAFPFGHKGIQAYALHRGCEWIAGQDIGGEMYSTSYYMDTLPQWAVDWNSEKAERFTGPLYWNLEKPLEVYKNKDNARIEGIENGSWEPVGDDPFPRVWDVEGDGPGRCRGPPTLDYTNAIKSHYFDKITLDFAREAIVGEELGQRDVPDFLQLSLSAIDYIGHFSGPESLEHEDMIYKLDKWIGELIDFIVSTGVKRKEIVVYFTADHGMSQLPEIGALEGLTYVGTTEELLGETCLSTYRNPGDRTGFDECVNTNSYVYEINEAVKLAFGLNYNVIMEERGFSRGSWSVSYPAFGKSFITFVPEVQSNPALHAIESLVADMIVRHKYFAKATTHYDISRGYVNDELFVDGFHPEVSGNVMFVVEQGVYHWPQFRSRGFWGNHGTIFDYDRSVPLAFWGANIESQVIRREVKHSAIAPTMTDIMKVGRPTGANGESLEEVLEKYPIF